MLKKTKFSGSALVFALVVMFIILTAALGVASVSVIDQKNSSATGKSTQSFQVADSAMELVLKKAALDPIGTTLNGLGTCTSGVVDVSSSLSLPANSVSVSFKDSLGADITTCAGYDLSDVSEVKAVATYGGTTRAISNAVAAGTLTWIPFPSFLNSWSNYGTGFIDARYAKDSRTGIVYLSGLIRHAAASGNLRIFNLPAGFRPTGNVAFSQACSTGAAYSCRVDISNLTVPGGVAGDVSLIAGSAGIVWLSLDGISFATN